MTTRPGTAPRQLPSTVRASLEKGFTADGLDDATMTYILALRPAFDLCRDAMGQLAGLMILAAAGSRDWRDRCLLDLATERLQAASALIRETRPTPAGRHHHHHLSACAALLRTANTRAGAVAGQCNEAGPMLALLRDASQQLQAASAALPGFAVVALEGCCCGTLRPLRPE